MTVYDGHGFISGYEVCASGTRAVCNVRPFVGDANSLFSGYTVMDSLGLEYPELSDQVPLRMSGVLRDCNAAYCRWSCELSTRLAEQS
jgi:hypothetical protein